jgi:hypothetical protein
VEYTLLCELFPDANILPLHIVRKDAFVSPVNDISEHHLEDRVGDHVILNTMDDSVYQDIHRFIQTIQEANKNP